MVGQCSGQFVLRQLLYGEGATRVPLEIVESQHVVGRAQVEIWAGETVISAEKSKTLRLLHRPSLLAAYLVDELVCAESLAFVRLWNPEQGVAVVQDEGSGFQVSHHLRWKQWTVETFRKAHGSVLGV